MILIKNRNRLHLINTFNNELNQKKLTKNLNLSSVDKKFPSKIIRNKKH